MNTISRTVLFNFNDDPLTHLKILDGTVSLTPTVMYPAHAPSDLPDPIVVPLVGGVASAPLMEPTPALNPDRTIEWAYLLRVENARKDYSWEYLVGVPDDTTDISYAILPRYFVVSPTAIGSVIPGPQGPVGPAGVQGPQGVQGIQGAQGLKGDMGETGATGAQGAQGTAGLKGDLGPIGPQGSQGAIGPQGLQGIAGDPGAQGPIGLQGVQGIRGLEGLPGAAGIQGPRGVQGEQGIQGAKGDKGEMGTPGLDGSSLAVTTATATRGSAFTGTFSGILTKQGMFTRFELHMINPAGNSVAIGTEVIVGTIPEGFRPTGRPSKVFVGDNTGNRTPKHAYIMYTNGNIGWTPIGAIAGNWTMDFSVVY